MLHKKSDETDVTVERCKVQSSETIVATAALVDPDFEHLLSLLLFSFQQAPSVASLATTAVERPLRLVILQGEVNQHLAGTLVVLVGSIHDWRVAATVEDIRHVELVLGRVE